MQFTDTSLLTDTLIQNTSHRLQSILESHNGEGEEAGRSRGRERFQRSWIHIPGQAWHTEPDDIQCLPTSELGTQHTLMVQD